MAGLTKIVITGLENGNVFEAHLNPSKYSLAYKNEYNKEAPEGSTKDNPKFHRVSSPAFDLEFLLDGTGVAGDSKGLGMLQGETVAGQFDMFLKTTGEYNGTSHRPSPVKIVWGILFFEGVMTDFTIDFTLFSPEGYPLRAIIKAKFQGSTEVKLAAAMAKKNSPDLTHVRTSMAGDTLPLMTYKIYGDTKYYLEVAKINNLINFRQLTPGQKLFFPPIEKQQ